MDLLAALQEDHREALRLLDRLEASLGGLRDPAGGIREEALSRAGRDWGEIRARLAGHFLREDGVLFPEAARTGRAGREVLENLRAEHREFSSMESEVEEALEGLRRGSGEREEDVRRLRRAGLGIVAHLREHIWKEEEVLFPLLRGRSGERAAGGGDGSHSGE